MLRRVLLGVVVLIVIGVLGLFVLAWRPAIDPVGSVSASDFPPDVIARGEVLASAGYCATCHTAKDGPRNAGGYPMATGFGTIHSTNITPDPQTGIGTWSEAAFARAMYEGVARDGSHLFPAFPFDHFTKVTDDDVRALYAYLMTRTPVNAPAKPNTVPFPLNIRALQAGWKLLFLRKGVFEPEAGKSAEWNRGAYLAEGLSHCGACHTPRNALGAEKHDAAYAGAIIDDWQAPPLTSANPAPLAWSVDELTAYLRSGATALHGSAAGPMSAVVHDGLSALPDADIRAIAVYFADINGSATRVTDTTTLATAMAASALGTRQQADAGAGLYLAACAACHYNSGTTPSIVRPELALNSALNSSDPTNLIQVVLHGIGTKEGIPEVLMPPFAHLSDADIAALATYLRRTRTGQPPWPDLPMKIAAIRKHGSES
jgi:mono/diheme cytochrome c family protein